MITNEAMNFLPAEIRKNVESMLVEINAMKAKREEKGLAYWDSRCACYASEVEKVRRGLVGAVGLYAEVSQKIADGSKRYTQESLDNVVERFFSVILANDLSEARFMPIDYTLYPNSDVTEKCDVSFRKITNRHVVDGIEVYLAWDYESKEPSYWLAMDLESGESAFEPTTPAEAVSVCKQRKLKNQEEEAFVKEKQYTLNELSKMHNLEIRAIARMRGLRDSSKKRIKKLVGEIIQPQLTFF